MKYLIALVLVAAVSADVSHLFSSSDNLQADGYHYQAPSQQYHAETHHVVDIPVVPEREYIPPQHAASAPSVHVHHQASAHESHHSVSPVQQSVAHHVAAAAPTAHQVSHHAAVSSQHIAAPSSYQGSGAAPAAGVLKQDGYHYEQPKTPFQPAPVQPAPTPKKEYLPPTNKPNPPVVPKPVAPKVEYLPPKPVAPKVNPPAPQRDYLPPNKVIPTARPQPKVTNRPNPAVVPKRPVAPQKPQNEYLPPQPHSGYNYPNDPQPPFQF